MASPQSESNTHQHDSPVSALSPQTHVESVDRDANAPEVVDAARTPSTFVASPATDYSHPSDGTEEGAKEAFAYDKSEKIAVPTAYEYQNSPYPQVVGGQNEGYASGGDTERNVDGAPASSGKETQPKILGLKKRTFYILLVAAFIIIAVAVGGGVGGALGSKKSSSGNGGTDPAATE